MLDFKYFPYLRNIGFFGFRILVLVVSAMNLKNLPDCPRVDERVFIQKNSLA